MGLKNKIMTLIEKSESGITNPEFKLDEAPGDKVGGFIISPTFVDKPQIERQNMVWDYLDDNLNEEQIRHIICLVTVTPDEDKED
jgi:acid stress-induced BolA-like protein IbaG/YrbA